MSSNLIKSASLALIAATLALASACNKSADERSKPQITDVGMLRRAYVDPARTSWSGDAQRPLSTVLWYPAAEGATGDTIAFPSDDPIFIGGVVQRDAAPKTAKAPLLVLSHGNGAAALQMMWLGRRLADAGFIVAAVDHHGNTVAEDEYDARAFRMIWERARDLSAVINSVLADPQFGPLVDRDRIGAGGFSAGGYTVLAVAGAVFDLDRFKAFCSSPAADATCGGQREFEEAAEQFEAMVAKDEAFAARVLSDAGASYRDPRVRAVFALAPGPGSALRPESLAAINIPVHLMTGEVDDVTPIATNARLLADTIPGAQFEPVAGVGHYVFLDPCTPNGKRHVPICKDSLGIEREQVHDSIANKAITFFEKNLGSTAQ